ncbi:MAG: FlgD immunoglobulin-like domain containing protein [Candidatus Eisenbacteria bacterium]|uniref:FlgD/Vpr Ig-like domain-containing protein n=1 Tax=Eiseniibacteriota bacterium TaxID=2212470 RepID=A0A956RQH5_UNCEI|nr:hypothetical protein [Candidatus Eisenbacteria bacterium]
MRRVWVLGLLLLITGVVDAEATTTIRRSVIAGGAVGASGASHAVRSTLGQVVIGSQAASSHRIHAGFWIARESAAEVPEAALPQAFRLYAATPNPFSSSVSLRFDVPSSGGHVSLRFYDVGGRIVRNLVDGGAAPGSDSVIWDGRDDRGNALAPGIYFGIFEAPGYRRVQKVIRTQ